ncbi:MAG: VanZ family protein [Eubacteriales bacterium]
MNHHNQEKKRVIIFLFLSYAFIVLLITQYRPGMVYLPHLSSVRFDTNFTPFLGFREALLHIRTTGLPGGAEASMRQVLLYIVRIAYGFFANIIMFIPLGIFLPLLFRKLDRLAKVTLVGFVFSLAIELSQLVVMMLFYASQRVFDIDDLIANTLGAAIGYIIYAFFSLLFKPQRRLLHA